MRKRALVLGNLPSVFVKDYISEVLVPLGYKVDVKVDFVTEKIRTESKIIAKELGIHLIENHELKITKFVRLMQRKPALKKFGSLLLGILYKYYSFISRLKGNYDVVYVINIHYEVLKHALRYSTKNNIMAATWIGSDILRRNDSELEKVWPVLEKFDVVTTLSSRLEKVFYEKFLKNREYTFLVKKIYIGQISFEYIEKLRDCKAPRKLQGNIIGEDRLVICVGYNASEAQQHKRVLEELSKLGDELKKKVLMVLQMSYGDVSGGKYTSEVVQLCKDIGFETIVYDEFFFYDVVAEIRYATDIYINSQTTDAFAGTIREYLYADTILFNAAWLEYEEFSEWGIKTSTFEDFSELPNMIANFNREEGLEIARKNREIVMNKFSWDRCRNEWARVFEGGQSEMDDKKFYM